MSKSLEESVNDEAIEELFRSDQFFELMASYVGLKIDLEQVLMVLPILRDAVRAEAEAKILGPESPDDAEAFEGTWEHG